MCDTSIVEKTVCIKEGWPSKNSTDLFYLIKIYFIFRYIRYIGNNLLILNATDKNCSMSYLIVLVSQLSKVTLIDR